MSAIPQKIIDGLNLALKSDMSYQKRLEAKEFFNSLWMYYQPKNTLETYLKSILERKKTVYNSYQMQIDRVSVLDHFEYYFISNFEKGFKSYSLPSDFENTILTETAILDGIELNLHNAHSDTLLLNLSAMIAHGAYLYPDAQAEKAHSDADDVYRSMFAWSNQTAYGDKKSLTLTKEIGTLCGQLPTDVNKIYFSKKELTYIYMFSLPEIYESPSNLDDTLEGEMSGVEQHARIAAYRGFITQGSKPHSLSEGQNLEKLNMQHRRELILIGWMAAKGYRPGDLISGYQRQQVWDELAEHCPNQLKATIERDSIEKFFKTCSKKGLCKFR